jgi:hypothetical protein
MTDAWRAEILNALAELEADSSVVGYCGGRRGFLAWQLKRLEKRFKLGSWEAYAGEYS